jgi:hypothetical protein
LDVVLWNFNVGTCQVVDPTDEISFPKEMAMAKEKNQNQPRINRFIGIECGAYQRSLWMAVAFFTPVVHTIEGQEAGIV